MDQNNSVNRRNFLKTTAAAGATVAMNAAVYNKVYGANDRLGIAFLGVGGRCQQHIDVILDLQRRGRSLAPVGCCDVWDGDPQLGSGRGRGLYPSARRCGLNVEDRAHVTKDYRRLLDLPEVDVVCVAAPDHWHAKMCIDAANAGKDIYCEKPMTRTIDEAHAVLDVVRRNNRVMTVGVQWMADPSWRIANEMIKRGDIGHMCQAQTSYYRNSLVGQWRYYPLTPAMTPTTIDWDMFLGHQFHVIPGVPLAPRMEFDRALFAQWRCYWQFGGGLYTDLFVHRTTRMIAAMGVRYPARVVGAGGIFLEYDGRDVPDVATIVADYGEGCQLIITGTMINDHPIEDCIRGRLATLNFKSRVIQRPHRPPQTDWGFEVIPQNISNRPTQGGPTNANRRFIGGGMSENDGTAALWLNFLDCCRTRNIQTWSTPELGAAAFTTVAMGVQSYRTGQALYWNSDQRRPITADSYWATQWERRSHERGQPNQVAGWVGGNSGSTLEPPQYQRLAGPWVNGRDPATPPAAGAAGAAAGSVASNNR
jgi:predicted dehydrogenase